jgi:hypothetical protein
MIGDWHLVLPYTKPVLTMNDVRGKAAHWSKQRTAKANVGRAVGLTGRALRVHPQRPVAVLLRYQPPDRRIRDADGLGWMMKACLDGLVDAGCLIGDDSRYVRRTTNEIAPGPFPGGLLTLRITELGDDDE